MHDNSVPGKRPLLGKSPYACTAFPGVNVAATIQMYKMAIQFMAK